MKKLSFLFDGGNSCRVCRGLRPGDKFDKRYREKEEHSYELIQEKSVENFVKQNFTRIVFYKLKKTLQKVKNIAKLKRFRNFELMLNTKLGF